MRDALLLPAASFAAGILVSAHLHPELRSLIIGLILLSGLWLLAWRRAGPCVRLATQVAIFVAAGATVAEWHRPGPPPELTAEDGAILLISGCVMEPVQSDGVQSRFVVELEPGARMRVTLTAREGEQLPRISYGDVVEVAARVRKPRNFQNPGAFDYVQWLRRQQIFWTASARGVETTQVLPQTCGTALRRWTLALRESIAERASAAASGDDYVSRLLPALLVGDNSGLDRSWTEDFRRTGTYHALVVSGLHITVVTAVALFAMRALGLPLAGTLLAAAALAWLYAAVVNWQPPVVRSAAGFTLYLVARWFFRRGRVLNLLGAVALVLLALDPAALFDPSAQLTFLSVAAIGGLAIPLIERSFGPYAAGVRLLPQSRADRQLEPRVAEFRIELRLLVETLWLWTRIPRTFQFAVMASILRLWFWAVETAVLSGAIQLALLVPMVAYFHATSLTGLLANLTIVPLLTAAVPVGFVAVATGWSPVGTCARFLVNGARWSSDFWSRIEPALRIPDPPAWAAALLLAATATLAIALLFRARRQWLALAALCVLASAALVVTAPFHPDVVADVMELTAIDVGQGDSLFVAFPDGKTMLLDSGGTPSFDRRIQSKLDMGEDVVSPYLWRRGLHRLDVVAISHLHEDHMGGMARIIRNFRPLELWIGAVAPSPGWNRIRAAAVEAGVKIVPMRAGASRSFGPAQATAVAPLQNYMPGESPHNSDSLVLLLTYGRHRFLLAGDAEGRDEPAISAGGLITDIDVLKVAHHGSRHSTTPEFLSEARPLFALISAGASNSYGHPHPDTLARLSAAGARVRRTDTDGLITIRTDGRRLTCEHYAGMESAGTPMLLDKSF